MQTTHLMSGIETYTTATEIVRAHSAGAPEASPITVSPTTSTVGCAAISTGLASANVSFQISIKAC